MSKLFLFFFLSYLLGNPIIAFIVILVLIYVVDRRFIGISPSLTKPFHRNRRIQALKREIELNPHHIRNKQDLGHLYLEKNQFRKALPFLTAAAEKMDDSAEVFYDLGVALIGLGQVDEGLSRIDRALELNPRVGYGDPYLFLARFHQSQGNQEKAASMLTRFHEVNASSSESYYRLGELYRAAGEQSRAREAYNEAIANYRISPRFKRKRDRRWAILAWWRKLTKLGKM